MIEVESYALYKVLKDKNIDLFSKLKEGFFVGYNLILFKKIENYYASTKEMCGLDEFNNLKKDNIVQNYFEKYVNDPEFKLLELDESFLCRQLNENSIKRTTLSGMEELLKNFETLEAGEVSDLVDKIQSELNTTQAKKEEVFDASDIATFPAAETFILYPSGLSNEWDSVNGGFALQTLVLFGGRRGSGKSIITLNTLRTRYEQGHSVALFSVEMRYVEVYNRLMSQVSGIPFLTIYKGQMTLQEKFKFAEARLSFWYKPTQQATELLHKLKANKDFQEFDRLCLKLPKKDNRFIIIDDVGLTLGKMDNYLRKFTQEYPNFSAFVLDYLNILNHPDRLNWKTQILMADATKEFTRKYNCTGISPYQMDADGEARFAKGILDSADVSLIFMPQDTQEKLDATPEEISTLKMYTSKVRNGRELTFGIGIHWPTVRVYPSGHILNSKLLPEEKYGSDNVIINKENATDLIIE